MARIPYDQPDGRPTQKVLFGALTGMVTWVLLNLAKMGFGEVIPDEFALGIPTIAAFVVSYFIRDTVEVKDETRSEES